MFQYKDILKKLTMEAKEKFNYGVNKARQQYNDIVTKYQHSNSGFKFFLDKFDTIKINTIYDNKASCKNNEDKLIWQNLINQVYQRDLLIGSFNKNNLSEVNSVIFQTLYEEIYPNSIWNKNVFFKGELVNLLKQLITKEEDWKRWNLYKSWDIKESPELNNIFIWNLNHQFSDVNSQSPIISFVMPNLVEGIDMSFVCTGDAANETFGFTNFYPHDGAFKVFNESKKNSICIRSIVVPHHGSSKNISRQMLDFFQPHILIFSAGIGMYEHPEKKTILDYSEFLKQQNYTEDLYKNFSLQTTNGLIFYEKDEGAFLYKNSNIPLKVCMISTNLFGNILVNQEGFKGQFSDIVEYPQGSNALYKVFFKERAEGREDCSHEEGELICQKEGTFWLLKSINNKKKSVEFIHYQAQKLDSELGK